jgi:hypothetical protein
MLKLLDIPDLANFGNCRDLVRVRFDTTLSDDITQVLSLGDLEGAFFRVQFNVKSLEIVEGFF